MGGLTSSLVISAALVASMNSNLEPPEPPLIQSQNLSSVSTPSENIAVSESSVLSRNPSSDRDNKSEYTSSLRNPLGIDISSHQHTPNGSIDIDKMATEGGDFAFIKATEGTGYINPYFRGDVIKFIQNKTPIGFYHYARPTKSEEDAREQARFFIRITGIDKGVKSFDPVLDIEEDEGLSSRELSRWVSAFVDEIKNKTGRDTMIYTYQSFWRNEMGNTSEFNHLPLWIADYNNKSNPNALPGGWTKWTFWQKTSAGIVSGVYGEVDVNIFNGSYGELLESYKKSPVNEDSKQVTPPKRKINSDNDSKQEESSKKHRQSAQVQDFTQFKSLKETFGNN